MYDQALLDIIDADIDHATKTERLQALYRDARDQQRAASESAMIDMDGLNDRLRQIELAAKELDIDLAEPEDNETATL